MLASAATGGEPQLPGEPLAPGVVLPPLPPAAVTRLPKLLAAPAEPLVNAVLYPHAAPPPPPRQLRCESYHRR